MPSLRAALLVEAVMIVVTGFVPKAAAVLCIALVLSVGGFAWGGFFTVNQLDIAPQYAGIVMGISNSLATVAALLVLLVGGYIVQQNPEVLFPTATSRPALPRDAPLCSRLSAPSFSLRRAALCPWRGCLLCSTICFIMIYKEGAFVYYVDLS